jgi:hypothetical protein
VPIYVTTVFAFTQTFDGSTEKGEVGIGSTVTLTTTGVPVQPPADGVIVKSTTLAEPDKFSTESTIVLPDPLEPSEPVHENVVPITHDVKEKSNGEPLQASCESGVATTVGTGLTVINWSVSPVTDVPQASVIVGGGTVNKVDVQDVNGQLGIVNVIVAEPVLPQMVVS